MVALVALLPGVGGWVAGDEHLQGGVAREKCNLGRRGKERRRGKESVKEKVVEQTKTQRTRIKYVIY